jgi:hypothetical protein
MGEAWFSERTALRVGGAFQTLVAIGALCFGWWATSKGLAISNDSVDYISSGLNLANGNGLETYSGVPLTFFPPGLPALLATGHLLGVTFQTTARLVNVTSIGTAAFLGMRIAAKYVHDPVQTLLTGCVIALSFSGTFVATFIWTEPLFVPLVLFSFVLYFRLARDFESWSSLAWLGIATGAAFMDRYSGCVLIPVFTISIAWEMRHQGKRAITNASAKVLIATSAVPALWITRNLLTDGTTFGFRPGSTQTFGPTIDSYLHQLLILFTVNPLNSMARKWSFIGLIALCAGALLGAALGRIRFPSHARRDVPLQSALLPLGMYLIIYSAFLIYTQLTTAIDPFDVRLMSPLLAPGVLFVVIAINSPRLPTKVISVPFISVVGMVVLVVLLYCQAISSVDMVANLRESNVITSVSSRVARAAVELPENVEYYTNIGFQLWVYRPRDGILDAPLRGWYRSNDLYRISPSFVKFVSCKPTLLVWADYGRNWFYTPKELSAFVSVKVVKTFADGTIYRLGSHDGVRNCST